MAPRDLFEIGFSYVQYLLLLIQISPTAFPSYYTIPFDVLRYFNLDLVNIFSSGARYNNVFDWQIPRWIPLDFRLQFTIVSVLIPLLASMLGMFSLAHKAFFLWYFTMLISLFLLVLGGLLLTNSEMFADSVSDSQRFYLLFVGSLVGGLMGVFGLLRFVYLRITEYPVDDADLLQANRPSGGVLELATRGEDPVGSILEHIFSDGGDGGDLNGDDLTQATKNENLNQILDRETANVDVTATVERLLYVVVTLFFGLSFIGLFPFIPPFAVFTDVQFWQYFGFVVLVFCAMFLTWFLMGFSRKGRMRQFHIQIYARDHFVSIQLLLVSLLYTPAVRNVINVFNCQKISCPAGMRFPIGESLFTDVKKGELCELCNFTAFAQACPLNLQQRLCGAPQTDFRLLTDSGITCDNVRPYFMPAAGLMLVSFVLSLPILNVILTRISSRLLDIEYPIDARQTEGYTEDERWFEKIRLSENVAKFIYSPFQRRFKHWRMFFLTQKLAIVVVSSVARSGTGVAGPALGIGLSVCIHFLLFLYIAVVSPFQRKAENLFYAVCQVMLSIVASLGCASAVGVPGPDSLLVIVAVCVFMLPLIALILGQVITFKNDIEQETEREERLRIAEQRAEHQDGDAETAGIHLTTATEDPDFRNLDDMTEAQVLTQPTVSMKKCTTTKGNAHCAARHERAPKAPTRDYHGKLTMLELVRTKAREREAELQQHQLLNLLHQTVTDQSHEDSGTFGGTGQSGGGAEEYSAFGAASMNLRNRANYNTKNTPAQSARARENWKLAKEVGLRKVRRDHAKRRGTVFGKQGGGAKTSKFEKLLTTLLAQARLEDDMEMSVRGNPMAPPATTNPFHQQAEGARAGRRNRNAAIGFDEHSDAKGSGPSATPQGLPLFSRLGGAPTPKSDGPHKSNNDSSLSGMEADDEVQLVQGAAAARRQHMQVRSKLKHIYDQQLVKLSLTQQAVDFKINKRTINAINIFFVFSGLLAVLAISFCLVGFFDSVDEAFYGNFDSNAGVVSTKQFAGYSNWTDFTEHCCCVASEQQRPIIPYYVIDVEGWLCANGNYRERIRSGISSRASGPIDGYAVRPLCGLTFLNGCSVNVNPTTSVTSLVGCSSAVTANQKLLW